MNSEQEFDRRLARIHGLVNASAGAEVAAPAVATDVRRAELEAMTDVFLGEDYDPVKRKQLNDLQAAMRREQMSLIQRHREGKLSAEAYVEACNSLLANTFKQCEAAVGQANFQRLFGSPRPGLSELVHRETFLGRRGTSAALKVFTCYANFCRVSVTPEELILDFGLNTQVVPNPDEPINLTSRVVMNYFTAKRLMNALQSVVSRHEQAFGTLELDARKRASVAHAGASRPS